MTYKILPRTVEIMARLKSGERLNRQDISSMFPGISGERAGKIGCATCQHLRKDGYAAGPVRYKGQRLVRYQTLSTAQEHDNSMGQHVKRSSSHLDSARTFIPKIAALRENEQGYAVALTQQLMIGAQNHMAEALNLIVLVTQQLVQAPALPALEEGQDD